MLVIRIELWSAITGEKTELARMHIINTGEGTKTQGSYIARTFRGRSAKALDKQTVARAAEITEWPRLRKHAWSLVAKMLATMGY